MPKRNTRIRRKVINSHTGVNPVKTLFKMTVASALAVVLLGVAFASEAKAQCA
jgi:hypothetical protein